MFSETAKSSKTPGKTRNVEKLLQRDLTRSKRGGTQRCFEVCKRDEGIYIVFGKSEDREDCLMLGGLAIVGGCILAATGLGLLALPVLGAGSAAFGDAYTKDALQFDKQKNLKQAGIGAIASGVGAVAAAGTGALLASKGLLAATVTSVASGEAGYVVTQKLNGEEITAVGALKAAAAGIVAPIASKTTGNLLYDLKGGEAFDKIVRSSAKGAAGSATSTMTTNVLSGKPLTAGIGLSVTLGAATSASTKLGKIGTEKPKTSPSLNPSSPSTTQPTFSKVTSDIWRNRITYLIKEKCEIFINGKWELVPKKDREYHISQFLAKIANGETLQFRPRRGGAWIFIGFEPPRWDSIWSGLQRGDQVLLDGKWVQEAPTKELVNQIMDKIQKGEVVEFKKPTHAAYYMADPKAKRGVENQPTNQPPKSPVPATTATDPVARTPQATPEPSSKRFEAERQPPAVNSTKAPERVVLPSSSSSSEAEDDYSVKSATRGQEAGNSFDRESLPVTDKGIESAGDDEVDMPAKFGDETRDFQDEDLQEALERSILDQAVASHRATRERIKDNLLTQLWAKEENLLCKINALAHELSAVEAKIRRDSSSNLLKAKKQQIEHLLSKLWDEYFSNKKTIQQVSR
ncbi:hypothetical protein [Estrella lausannensis]|uniref:hypothetical protein n=1 Tax=Estrella lausannensis TaxID=483423 RepID=UPI000BEF8F43|nr:hypothetical protein [Estrella lausannensis]